ncbi:ubiquinol oxidase [Chloropicon primus]|nr:oxidase [Chloropicon primus]UPR03999.1 ubiquinol oxidase [Chloropicon primus]|eukprot:QDZ24790.1 oxidase [Chloropicon primus]
MRGGLRVARLLGVEVAPWTGLGWKATPLKSDARFYAAYKAKEMTKENRRYHWIEPEAERLIARAYARHKTLVERDVAMPNGWRSFPPSISLKDLESEAIAKEYHYEPRTLGDRIAKKLVDGGEKLMELFFREKYDHHAVTLETVAAVPGVVGAAHRHLRSLRCMKRDHGWINPLQEEAENERMHLLIWMQHTKPTSFERAFVMCAQGVYVAAYSVLMFLSPRTAHRTVGYLEEAAHRAYTEYLEAVDEGAIPNVPAGDIAKAYYRLPDDATLRDVILHVRADECMHRDFNHHLGDLYDSNEQDEFPVKMDENASKDATTNSRPSLERDTA